MSCKFGALTQCPSKFLFTIDSAEASEEAMKQILEAIRKIPTQNGERVVLDITARVMPTKMEWPAWCDEVMKTLVSPH